MKEEGRKRQSAGTCGCGKIDAMSLTEEVGRKPPTKGYVPPLEAGQGKETDSPLKPPEMDQALPTP